MFPQPTKPIELILVSQSPRRRELIQLAGFPVQLMNADVDERSITHPDPMVNVVQTAELKAHAILSHITPSPHSRQIIVAADTTVALNGRMLSKPTDEAEAWQMLADLRGRTHQVHTGLTLLDVNSGQQVSGVNTAVVTMRPYTDEEIAAYIATGDPMDKAGAYAVQHPMFRPVAHLEGCYLCVVGLSVCHLAQTLCSLGVSFAGAETAVFQAHQGFPCSLFTVLSESC